MTNTTKQPSAVRSREKQIEGLSYAIQMGTAYAWQEARLKAEKHILEAEQRGRVKDWLGRMEESAARLSDRTDVAQWQKDQNEFFDPSIREIVERYAEWRDKAEKSGEPACWVDEGSFPNEDFPHLDATLWASDQGNDRMTPLYTAAQPDAQAEKVARLEAENAQLQNIRIAAQRLCDVRGTSDILKARIALRAALASDQKESAA
ncbi:hypothetical protein [Kozakia baliensis]|uniref:hypothetical protein n=1 Tax=Kozakia baliensis TaxID=153496 RepID=UPI0004964207|nr:hypothetical protein [Kozakia baliensis]